MLSRAHRTVKRKKEKRKRKRKRKGKEKKNLLSLSSLALSLSFLLSSYVLRRKAYLLLPKDQVWNKVIF